MKLPPSADIVHSYTPLEIQELYGKDAFYVFLDTNQFEIQSKKTTANNREVRYAYRELVTLWEPIIFGLSKNLPYCNEWILWWKGNNSWDDYARTRDDLRGWSRLGKYWEHRSSYRRTSRWSIWGKKDTCKVSWIYEKSSTIFESTTQYMYEKGRK